MSHLVLYLHLYGYIFTVIDTTVKKGAFSGDLAKTKSELKGVRDMLKMIISEIETQFRS